MNSLLSLMEEGQKEVLSFKKDKPFDHSYSYLGAGGTCYAFVSDDGKEVIKVLKKHHFFKTKIFEGFPRFSWVYLSKSEKEKMQKKFSRVYESLEIAASSLKDECGIIDANFTKDAAFPVILKDKLGSPHEIDANGLMHVRQKKAILPKEYFRKTFEDQNEEEFVKAITSIFSLFQSIEAKGFCILDPRIETNVGFCEEKPIFIDVGCLVRAPKEKSEQNLLRQKYRSLKSFQEYLNKINPRYAELFREQYEQFLAS